MRLTFARAGLGYAMLDLCSLLQAMDGRLWTECVVVAGLLAGFLPMLRLPIFWRVCAENLAELFDSTKAIWLAALGADLLDAISDPPFLSSKYRPYHTRPQVYRPYFAGAINRIPSSAVKYVV